MIEFSPSPEAEKLPVVAIVGRPNVGKSSLLNLLAHRRVAIVHPTSGVTRDRVSALAEHEGSVFEAWDTGGMGMADQQHLEQEVKAQIDIALKKADVILFVVDARRGFDEADHRIANALRRTAKPVVLVANKVDHLSHEHLLPELHRLGLGEPAGVSALHGLGRMQLLDRVVSLLPRRRMRRPEPELTLAIVGRQNVGKSTLVNQLVREERMIVSELPGTTRDAVDVQFRWEGRDYLLIDTAGLKRRAKVRGDLEFYSTHRAERSIRRADVTLFLLDTSRDIARTDEKIASYIEQQGKPCVILVNKWDLARDTDPEQFTRYLNDRMRVLSYAPILYISAREGKNVAEILPLVCALHEQAGIRVGTGELNRAFQEARRANPPPAKGAAHPRMLYVTQVGTRPPTFVVFVNRLDAFRDSYRRFLANFLRKRFAFKEVPVHIEFRGRSRTTARKEPARKRRRT